MAKIIFSKSGAPTVTFERGRIYPITEPVEVYQRRHETEAMRSKVISYGVKSTLINVRLEGVSRANFDQANGVKTFFESSAVNWSENTFTMTDETGAARTVRLWQDNFQMDENSPNRYSVNLLLKVET